MKTLAIAAQFAIIVAVASAQITDPDRIELRQKQTYQFTGKCPSGHNCQFEMLPGHDSTSSVTPGGLYTAPARVERHGKVAGCPLLPHNNIFNVRVDEMPVHPKSDEFMARLRDTNSYAYHNVHLPPPGLVANQLSDNVPKYHIKTFYYPKWDGDYRLSTPPSVNFGSRDDPKARVQTGWYIGAADNHYIGVNRDTCEISEFYQLSAPGESYRTCPACSAGAAVAYPSMTFANADGIAGKNAGSTIAVGTWLTPLELSQSELMEAVQQQGSEAMVRHALAVTVSNFALLRSAFAWPGTQVAWSGSGNVPYGTRLRLKGSFVDAYNPALDTSDPTVQALIMAFLRTLQHYGMIVMDGTSNSDSFGMHLRTERVYISEVGAALGTMTYSPQLKDNKLINALEVVDESGYQVSATSDVVRHPSANPEAVIYRDTTTGAVLDVRDIAIHPPTVGTFQAQYNVAAGAPPIDFRQNVFATGLSDNSALTWTIAQGGGSISDQGVYTPPDNIAAATSFTVRAAAKEDPSAYVELRVVVFPAIGAGLYIRDSSKAKPSANIAEGGRTWWNADTSGRAISPMGDTSYGNSGIGGTAIDPSVYPSSVYANAGYPGEKVFSVYLPNGRYRVRLLINTGAASPTSGKVQIEMNGAVVQPPTRFHDVAAGKKFLGFPADYPATVSNGELVIGWKPVVSATEFCSAFAILPDTSDPHLEISTSPAEIALNGSYQFTAIGFSLDSAATWSISPKIGSIDAATGRYTAPQNSYAAPQTITVTATPIGNAGKPATRTFKLVFGNLTASAPAAVNRSAKVPISSQLNGAPFDKLTWTASPVGSMAGNVYRAPDVLESDTTVTITGTVDGDPTQSVSVTLTVRAQPVPVRVSFGVGGSGNGCGFQNADTGDVWTCYALYGAFKQGLDPGYTLGPNTATLFEWGPVSTADFGMGPLNRLYQSGVRTGTPGSSWDYTTPSLPAGLYSVALHFGSAQARGTMQNLNINGVRVATNFKPAAVALFPQTLTYPVRLNSSGDIAVHIADSGGSDSSNYTLLNGVEVLPVTTPAPTVSSFVADPQFIRSGDSATLAWSTANAATVEIDNGIGPVPTSGSVVTAPAETIDYVLTASNERGKAVGVVRVYVHRDPRRF